MQLLAYLAHIVSMHGPLMMQVHRNTVFADACTALLPETPPKMSSGPCVISPTFFAASPDTTPCQLGSSPGSMQRSGSTERSQVIGHSTARYSGTNEPPSTAPEVAQHDEADHPAVLGNVSGVSAALQEEGEGRGPQKEFFAAVAADITSAGCSSGSSLNFHVHVGVCQKLASLLFCVHLSDMCI